MAITTTWSIADMKRNNSDGGVILVYWSLVAQSDGTPSYSATEDGKFSLTYDASDPNFIAYDSLTEADGLGWVYNSLIEGDETATEAKTRIETERTAKVQAQIDRASSQSTGVPW